MAESKTETKTEAKKASKEALALVKTPAGSAESRKAWNALYAFHGVVKRLGHVASGENPLATWADQTGGEGNQQNCIMGPAGDRANDDYRLALGTAKKIHASRKGGR